MNRCILFAVVIGIGETSCFLTYFARTYAELFVYRAFTGFSVGGAGPIIYSLLADFYPGESRIHVATLVGAASSIGLTSGQTFAGLIGPRYGWRLPFLIIPIPAIICAVLLMTTTKEPQRGGQEEIVLALTNNKADGETSYNVQTSSEKITIPKLRQLFRTPTVLVFFIMGFPCCIPWGVISVYLNDYLSSNRGFTITGATLVLFLYGVGGLVGGLLGGWIGQTIYNVNKQLLCIMMGSVAIAGVIPLLYLLNGPTGPESLSMYFFVSFVGGILSSAAVPGMRSVLQVRIPLNVTLSLENTHILTNTDFYV